MAYTVTRYSAQFGHRLIDNIQIILERDLDTALAELDSTLDEFKDYRTPTQIALNFPALFVAPSNVAMSQTDDDSYIESTNEFLIDLAIVGKDTYTLTRNILKYMLMVDRVLRTATNDDITDGVSSSITKAVWEPTEHQFGVLRSNDTIYRLDARLILVVQLLER